MFDDGLSLFETALSFADLINTCGVPLFLQVSPTHNGHSAEADPSDPAVKEDAQSSYHSSRQGYAIT